MVDVETFLLIHDLFNGAVKIIKEAFVARATEVSLQIESIG